MRPAQHRWEQEGSALLDAMEAELTARYADFHSATADSVARAKQLLSTIEIFKLRVDRFIAAMNKQRAERYRGLTK